MFQDTKDSFDAFLRFHPFTPSKQQHSFFSWVYTGEGSATLVAVAGSGKTSSVVQSWIYIPDSAHVQAFAFNSTIASELKASIGKLQTMLEEQGVHRTFAHFRANTFHSVGNSAVCKFLRKRPQDIKADKNKLRRLMDANFAPETCEIYGTFSTKLVSLAKGEGIGALVADTDAAWWALVHHHDLFLDVEVDADGNEVTEARGVEIARKLLGLSNAAAKQYADIDFDDQLYLVVLWKLRLWQNDWVFVDEAQDTNPVRRAIARLALKPGGRLVAVGDPRQAIYGFTGASHDAIDLIERDFHATRMPLTVSYRCSQAVVAHAQELVDYIQSSPTAPVGCVDSRTLRQALTLLTHEDAILCRNTAPLVSLAYTLIASGRACRVLGREIGQGLVNLVKQQKARGVDSLVQKLTSWKEREVAKFTARGEEQKAEAVTDRVECIFTVVNHLAASDRTVPAVIAKLESLFSDQGGALTLSTIHKAKGREWVRVAVLSPELMPSPWARQEWQQLQEENLMYVCRTRAKLHTMVLTTTTLEQDTRHPDPAPIVIHGQAIAA